MMKQIAEDVHLLAGFPPNGINVYLIGDVILDAGTKLAKGRILRQVRGRTVRAHALTHAHPDHQGASHAVCEALNIPFWVSEGDADAAESGDLSGTMPKGALSRISAGMIGGPGHPVAKRLKEGDLAGGFTVIETPGHSPGHVSYWRESDRLLITGDVVFNMNILTGIPGLHEPPRFFTVDPALNRESARKLASLRPETVCFGHGPPLPSGARFVEFVRGIN
jgi:glyoxylase-like metal-dependent hydrolase (beta-lactamase superfamily II)